MFTLESSWPSPASWGAGKTRGGAPAHGGGQPPRGIHVPIAILAKHGQLASAVPPPRFTEARPGNSCASDGCGVLATGSRNRGCPPAHLEYVISSGSCGLRVLRGEGEIIEPHVLIHRRA